MIVPKSMKLNHFRLVAIPKNEDYFGKHSSHNIPAKSMYSGEDYIPPVESKIQSLHRSMQDNAKYLKEEDAEGS